MTRSLLAGWLACTPILAWPSPGAHGPNGEHLDAPSQAAAPPGAAPRFEAQSETFEVVGHLQGGELSMFVQRFESNDPVLDAKVEVAQGDLKAAAPFHADQGDYAVADAAMLKALAVPGDHVLVLTLVAGDETDLLEGTLHVPAAAVAAPAAAVPRWAVGAVIAALLLVALGWRGRHRRAGGAQ